MKKICIGIAIAAVLLAALFIVYFFCMDKAEVNVEVTTSYTDENGIYHVHKYSTSQSSSDTELLLEKENEISALLMQADRVDSAAVSISSVDPSDDFMGAAVSVSITLNRTAEAAEINGIADTIALNLGGVKNENIIILDQSGVILYHVM